MAKTSLAALESVLRERKLDRTLSSAAPLAGQDSAYTATTIPAIDASLKGGLPRGHLCELTGPHGAGRTTLALQLMAGVTGKGEIAAFIDTCDRLDVASAHAAGVDLARLLWVRGYSTTQADRDNGALSALERAIKALHLVLQAGGFSVVTIDLVDVPAATLKRLPFTTWLRLQRAVEGSETTCLLLASTPVARSAGGVTVALSGQAQWTGSGRSQRFSGMSVAARMQSPRRYANGDATFAAIAVDA
jgi:hypothetical protein